MIVYLPGVVHQIIVQGWIMVLGVARNCRCGLTFRYCQHCWRNQKYCSTRCSRSAKAQSHRSANQKYSKTDKGRENNRQRQKRYRCRENLKASVTDQSSTEGTAAVEDPNPETKGPQFCGRCGRRIDQFVKEHESDVGIGKSRRQSPQAG